MSIVHKGVTYQWLTAEQVEKLNSYNSNFNTINLAEIIDTALDAEFGGHLPADSVSNDELGTDVKVGSLATLTTTAVDSVVAAINELDADKANVPAGGAVIGNMAEFVDVDGNLADSGITALSLATKVNQTGTYSTGMLTISNLPADEETVTIGADLYEFDDDGVTGQIAAVYTPIGAPALDDIIQVGNFSGAAPVNFVITIDHESTGPADPDTFSWTDGVDTFPGIAITPGTPIALTDGVSIDFGADTGHTLGDLWTIVTYAAIPVVISIDPLASRTNLVTAINTLGTEDVFAEDIVPATAVNVTHADAPGGAIEVGEFSVVVTHTLAGLGDGWNIADLGDVGKDASGEEAVVEIEYDATSAASDVLVRAPFNIDYFSFSCYGAGGDLKPSDQVVTLVAPNMLMIHPGAMGALVNGDFIKIHMFA